MIFSERIKLAKKTLLGVSIGDAFGESFFGDHETIENFIQQKKVPVGASWDFTDDTIMALAVFEQLEIYQKINQKELIKTFIINHDKDPNRGYGATLRRILREVGEGGDWKEISNAVFDGMGSMGNGASMRVAPIGAFYHDDLRQVVESATESAIVTHANQEAIAGAIAVSVAAALSTNIGMGNYTMIPNEFIAEVGRYLPDTDTKAKLMKSMGVSSNYHMETVKSILGNGTKIMAQDTVPFCIWCAAHHLGNFEHSLWKAISVLGDRDTICAIVGGITILSSPNEKIPDLWLKSVEKVDESVFRSK